MKNIILGIAIAATTLAACNNGNKNNTDINKKAEASEEVMTAQPPAMHETVTTKNAVEFPVKEIITEYLQVKNALANDNGNNAATAAKAIATTLSNVDMKSISAAQMSSYMDIAGDLKEHAEHIGGNADKMDHQREHFQMLSKDIEDLIKAFGAGGQTLYKDYCPMADDGKGAIWISEVKEIKNPYMGSKMPKCGSVKEIIK